MFEDEIGRTAFADLDMVRHLLELLPDDATAGLDTRRLRRLPAEQIGRGARRRIADMAWAVGAPTPERPDAEALLAIRVPSHASCAYGAAPTWRCCARRWRRSCRPPPVLPVLAYTGDRPWRPAGLRQLTAPAPAGLRRWQPDLEMLSLDAAALTAEDAESTRRRRCWRTRRTSNGSRKWATWWLRERGGAAAARQRFAQRRELARSAAPDTAATTPGDA